MTAQAVTLYRKPGCHLCEDALGLLHRIGQDLRLDLSVDQVDISADAGLEERYGDKIPVIVLANGFTLAAPIEAGPLRSALQAAVR